ncbi:hypothetical protein ACKVMT_16065 [Halobacteriales archaeon Cl-PHB]
MVTNLALRIGKYLPPRIKSSLCPAYIYANSIERYFRHLSKKRKPDRIIETEYDFQMKIDTSDFVQRRHITQEGEAEKHLTEFFYKKMKTIDYSGDIIDVGANVGFYSLVFSQMNQGAVFAFEPLCYNVKNSKRI